MPATTNNLTKAIVNYLNSRGHFAFRVNNGAVYDPVRKVFRRRRKGDPAISDVHCTLNPSGLSLWIEVKNAYTRDRIKKGQRDFAKRIKECGGMHLFATTYDRFLAWYDDNVFDNASYNPCGAGMSVVGCEG